MSTLEFLRSFRIAEYAVFDFVLSFVVVFFLAPLLSKAFRKFGLDISRQSWLFLTMPLAFLAHVLVGEMTPMTKEILDPHGHYFVKILMAGLLLAGLRGINTIRPMPNKAPLRLLVSLFFPLVLGFLASLVTMPAIEGWYANLVQPALTPPNSIFGPVWTSLYIMMGFALFFLWQDPKGPPSLRKTAFVLFAVQLALNTSWSFVFFGMQNPGLALVNIGLLWLSILACILSFYKQNKLSAWLMIPYFLWVSFASYLNASLAMLN